MWRKIRTRSVVKSFQLHTRQIKTRFSYLFSFCGFILLHCLFHLPATSQTIPPDVFKDKYRIDLEFFSYNVNRIDKVAIETKGKYGGVDHVAFYGYGNTALLEFVSENFPIQKVPAGEKFFLFVIEAQINIDCSLHDFRIAYNDDTAMVSELIRILALTKARWVPATREMQAVNSDLMFVFRFSLK